MSCSLMSHASCPELLPRLLSRAMSCSCLLSFASSCCCLLPQAAAFSCHKPLLPPPAVSCCHLLPPLAASCSCHKLHGSNVSIRYIIKVPISIPISGPNEVISLIRETGSRFRPPP
ncbi:hypothetical protein CRG98_005106 [Punica granatum]|uniref:Uncharacterized protein n=1 Tax=Punica granatum TaxID=22663 RepID=A0A2I0L2W2_PUNGR|nr:hypothetical protein CRG98_005106 [Punica granatum]